VFERLHEVIRHTPRTADRRFLNQLFAGRQEMAVAGELIATMLNVSMYTYKAAGAQVLLEWELLQRMLELCEMPEGDGGFLPGGSLANLIGMLLGRNQAAPNMRERGAPSQRLCSYVSADGHYSIPKNSGVLGMGRANVRKVAVDERGMMCPRALSEMIEADLAAGHLPAVVIATSGTTVRGAFDSLEDLADVCAEHKIWFHVDAAVGGSFLLLPSERHKLAGISRADSVTWDAHKMMGVPLTCSAILVRDRNALAAALSETADYLFQNDDERLNPGTRSLLCGRRNDALKLWTAWQSLGDKGWEDRLQTQRNLAFYAAKRVSELPEFELCEEPDMVMINFILPRKSSPAICSSLQKDGDALIGYGDCGGVQAIRLVTMNPELTEADLDQLFDSISKLARKLPDDASAIENQSALLAH